jgi:2-polyprenyl-3-methyl-5-hydroxy-6-metoxy-1,4-benzoquinol methylase
MEPQKGSDKMRTSIGKSNYMGEIDNQNHAWWQENPMTYDWERTISVEKFSAAWYDEIDLRFFRSAYYAQRDGSPPFSAFIPEDALRGKRVLEIGCGMGTHAELLTRRGARLTAIDQTAFAVEATTRRLKMKGLAHDVRQVDAEILPLPEHEFDIVWSWGVIHHSRSTEAIVANIVRVLKPGGSLHFMVYYRPSLVYWLHCGFIRGVLMGQLLRKDLKEIYVDNTDGFFARTFTKAEIRQLLGDRFEPPRFTVIGQKAELYPIPRTSFKAALEDITPNWFAYRILGRWGSMIYIEAIRK